MKSQLKSDCYNDTRSKFVKPLYKYIRDNGILFDDFEIRNLIGETENRLLIENDYIQHFD